MPFFERLAERFVLPRRLERMRAVLAERTLYITPVLENVKKAHNASAIVRSCDALGIAEAHFIERDNAYGLHPEITQGAHNWVRLRDWKSAEACFEALRNEGYRIVGTSLHDTALDLSALPLDTPLAFVFGNERDGLTPATAQACDLLLKVPMRGFAESLNVSVAAALILYTHLERIRALGDDRLRLSDRARKKLFRRWLISCTRAGVIIRKMRLQKRIAAGLEEGEDED
jgi:tRNA (guanosine-2'-O-)-methyltransferase